jgi:hypothetical protein
VAEPPGDLDRIVASLDLARVRRLAQLGQHAAQLGPRIDAGLARELVPAARRPAA